MAKNSYSFQAGSLRRRVDIQKPTVTRDDVGAPTTTWAALYEDVPAAIESVGGREFYAARQLQSDATQQITIRYRPKIDATCRIIHYLHPDECGSPPDVEIFNIEG